MAYRCNKKCMKYSLTGNYYDIIDQRKRFTRNFNHDEKKGKRKEKCM